MATKWTARVCCRCAARIKGCRPLKPHIPFQLRPVPSRMQHAGLSSKLSPVLGIETSCDDTGVAVVDWSGNILGEALHSQLSVHQATGGVVPSVAGDLHRESLQRVTEEALGQSGLALGEIGAVAVTTGPGLALCLRAGLQFAKEMVQRADKPLVPVHHMEAHALMPRMENDLPFPYLVLLVSGGHCILALVHGPGQFSRLGESGDDSPGEALDKVARWLRLESHPEVSHLPGGAAIEVLAERGDPQRHYLPHVMARRLCCGFSFAGLKTATKKIILKLALQTGWEEGPVRGCEDGWEEGPVRGCADVAASFQEAMTKHLVTRTHRAILFLREREPSVRHLVVSGGVASNQYLRAQLGGLASAYGYSLLCPPPRLCTDNGVMIAWAAVEHLKVGRGIATDPEAVEYTPKWPLGTDISHEVQEARIKLPQKPTEL